MSLTSGLLGQEFSPGPNNYDVKIDWNKGVPIGKERRLQSADGKSQHPGPGDYRLPSSFDDKGKGVYMAGRYSSKDRDMGPGPGAYYLNDYKGGPHYSITGKGLEGKLDSGPGPAAYDASKSYNAVYN